MTAMQICDPETRLLGVGIELKQVSRYGNRRQHGLKQHKEAKQWTNKKKTTRGHTKKG